MLPGLASGVSGGVARIMVGQPFDTVKTRLQVLGNGTIGAAGMPPEMVYNSGKQPLPLDPTTWQEACSSAAASRFAALLLH
jgi:hypothetical protein